MPRNTRPADPAFSAAPDDCLAAVHHSFQRRGWVWTLLAGGVTSQSHGVYKSSGAATAALERHWSAIALLGKGAISITVMRESDTPRMAVPNYLKAMHRTRSKPALANNSKP